MNPKGEKNWKIGKWIIDHIKLSIKKLESVIKSKFEPILLIGGA